ncbi:peptidase inhibitor family I36 protein [Frankia sp. Cj5]|uniref:peptidase inhibitor family I36 protein n=1 Tax=Frankia sp. Cj5 TaxID=2880978 RepID=UPI001EF4D86A|nr:peptidase inhibitor family I36 protein [Frankia sp. Cj5]
MIYTPRNKGARRVAMAIHNHEGMPMKRTRKLFATFITALLLAGLGVVFTSSPALANGCTIPPCGEVINHSGQTIQIRWYVDGQGWHQESLANGEACGGYYHDGADVDQFYVPLGCVGKVSVNDNGVNYFPGNWDKLGDFQTVTVNGFSCGDGYVYAWNNIWNDDNYATAVCRWYNDDSTWGDDCGNFRNRAGAVQNNSAHGNSINFYFHTNYTGAWGCLGAGSVWRDLRYNYFSWGPGLDGYGKALRNEIASSKWVHSCGN